MNLVFNTLGKGNADYYGFFNGQKAIKNALEKQGVNIVLDADYELYHCSSHLYTKDQSRKSFLYMPYECNDVPKSLINKLNEADVVIATCKYNADVFKKDGVTKPIEICMQGIDTDIYKYKSKKNIKGNCRFLWVGQSSLRKGWDLVVEAFQEEFKTNEHAELYIKTTGTSDYILESMYNDKVFFDSRNLALPDMLDLYDSSHVFVLPSRGESVGLPCLEAMSMGLVVLAPSAFGMKDFINEKTALPLDYDLIDADFGIKTKVPNVKIKSLRESMRFAFDNFNNLSKKIKYASNFVKKHYNINKTAKRLIDIIYS